MKRIISLALCFMLVFTLCPLVLAEGGTVHTVYDQPTLTNALAAAQTGDTIKLTANITYNSTIVIEDKRITFDLNGYTLNVVNNAEADTAKEMSGLFVIGDAAVDLVDLSGAGELNVTGSWYGVYAASTVDETDSVTNYNTSVTVTNALGHKYAGVIANNAKVTVKGNAASDAGGYGASASFQYAEVTVEGNVKAGGDGCIGILPNSSAKITVKGSVTVSGYNSEGIVAYDRGEAIVENDITASGTGSIGINSWSSNVTAGGNVTGDYGGINAYGSDVDITGDVRSLGVEVNSYGVCATSFSHIYVEGDVRSNEEGAVIWAEDNETPSMIVIGGVIEAPKYVRIGIKTLDFTDGQHTTTIYGCYIIYEDPEDIYVGAVGVAEYAGGSGSVEDPYLVAHADQLYNVRNHLDKHFKLIENIDLSGYSTGAGWEPIGTSANPFAGTFDGDGKVINNLFISRGTSDTSDYVGLFGYTGNTAEIRNLGLENAGTTGRNFVGSLIGYSMGKIMNSYSAGNVNGSQFVGGLVGYNFREGLSLGGTITSSYSSCTVTAMDFDAGGLAGRNARGVIANSFATGNVSSPVSVGGLVGASVGEVGNKNVGLITNSYATGEVSATDQDAGGLVGQNSALISYSFATGGVSCPKNVGGLAGYIYNWGRTENSYWDTITSDQNASAGGGTGKTTAEMKQQITYADWDFATIWGIGVGNNNGYPFLRWQGYEAEPTAPSAPQNFTATSGDGQVALSWTAPASDGGAAISHYEVSSDNGGTWVTAATNTSHIFTGLTNGTAYTFKVRAVNGIGSGAEASVSATPIAGPTVPAAPQNFTARPFNGLVVLDWDAPASDGGAAISRYEVSSDSGDTWVTAATNTSHTFTGLTNGTAYTFKVRAVNGIGSGAEASVSATPVASTGGEFAGGDGSEDNPYLIATADQLNNVRDHLDKHFRQTADLDLSGYSTGDGWEPIGMSVDFTGSFDGGGYTISGLVINRPAQDDIGLFGYAETTAKIRNLGLVGVNVTGCNYVGGLVGGNRGLVTNSYVTGDVNGSNYVGGLVGQNYGQVTNSYVTGDVNGGGQVGGLVGNNYGAITESYAVGEVEGTDVVGGLVGINNEGNIDKSYATGTVTGTETGINYTYVGGLVGSNTGPISNSFARGAVSGEEDIGGLVGYNSGLITVSYSTGAVSGDSYIGGLVGFNHSEGTITGSYWDTETSLQASSDGGTGKSTVEMKQQETYDGWDFAATWVINASDNDGYPFLAVPTAPTVPAMPQNFTATPGNGQVALSWAAPASDGGSPITKYQVSEDNGANWTDVGLNTSHTFTGLTNGTAYTFKVRAVNSVGSGAEASATATPTAAAAPTYTVTVTNGAGGGEFSQGVTVTITANSAPDGQRFKEWQVISGGIALVNSQEASTSFQMPANAVEVAATYETIPETTYTVTVNGSYAAATGAGSYAQDVTVTIDAGSRTNYSFNSWTSLEGVTFTNSNSAITTFTMPPRSVTVTANWTYSGGSSGGGGSSTPTTPAAPSYKADVKAGSGAEMTLPVTVDKNAGTASIDTGSQGLDQGGTNITIPSIPDVDAYSVGIPVPDLSTSDIQGTLTVNTAAGNITVPSNMLTGVSGISGSKADIAIGQGDKDNLPDAVKAAIGDRPLVQLTLSIDGKRTDWSNPDAPVTVSIPYTPTAAELANPESIVVWYIDGSGNAVSVPNGHYNPATGMVTFDTTHFSDYAVAYNKVSFNDVTAGAWYHKAISFIAARGITGGTGNGNYSPEAKLTRGQFIVMLMKAYGIAPDADPKNNFADAGATYYTGYLAAAKRLSISSGVGNNMFAPEKEITRQEMFTLLYNALKIIGQLPQGDSSKALDHFSDAGQIDSWAKEAMTLMVKTGTIVGNAGKLNPTSTTTRAEMAQVLYNLLSK